MLYFSFWENVFSVKNEDIHKVVTLLGVKFKKKNLKKTRAETVWSNIITDLIIQSFLTK